MGCKLHVYANAYLDEHVFRDNQRVICQAASYNWVQSNTQYPERRSFSKPLASPADSLKPSVHGCRSIRGNRVWHWKCSQNQCARSFATLIVRLFSLSSFPESNVWDSMTQMKLSTDHTCRRINSPTKVLNKKIMIPQLLPSTLPLAQLEIN